MAISAGAPALPKKLLKLGANPPYVYSLAVIMSLLAIVTVPVSLAVLGAFFGRDVSVPTGQVALKIGTMLLAPLFAGIASLNFPNAKPLPIVVCYLVISAVTVIPYMRWRKGQRGERTVPGDEYGFHPSV